MPPSSRRGRAAVRRFSSRRKPRELLRMRPARSVRQGRCRKTGLSDMLAQGGRPSARRFGVGSSVKGRWSKFRDRDRAAGNGEARWGGRPSISSHAAGPRHRQAPKGPGRRFEDLGVFAYFGGDKRQLPPGPIQKDARSQVPYQGPVLEGPQPALQGEASIQGPKHGRAEARPSADFEDCSRLWASDISGT